jgi:tripartite-type tricarboxylate transporter receptor subunit TctC
MAAALALGLACFIAVLPQAASADAAEDFYKGKTVKLIMGAAPGGGADLYARSVVKFLGKHLPGHPTFVLLNQPGAGGLVAAGGIQNTAPRDGSTVGFLQRNNLLEPLLAENDTGFDPRKVVWVGSLNKDTYLIFSWHTSGIKKLEDAQQRELILGNTGGGNENLTFPLLLNQTIGTKFKLVRGYKGSDEVALAIERGEVQGRAITWTTLRGEHSDWIKDGKVSILVQLAVRRHPDLPQVPLAVDFVRNDEDRQLFDLMFAPLDAGRPFAVPLETPPDRVAALRAAFAGLAQDAEFVAELTQRGGTVEFMSGEDMQALVTKLYATPAPLIAKARELVKR